jgi:hypothetical protein
MMDRVTAFQAKPWRPTFEKSCWIERGKGDGLADLVDRHLNLRAECEMGRHPGMRTALHRAQPSGRWRSQVTGIWPLWWLGKG